MLNVCAIPTPEPMAPNADIALVETPRISVVYFACYDNEANVEITEYIGRLTADRTVAIRMYGFEGAPINIVENVSDSYIYEVIDSEWLVEVNAEARRRYPNTTRESQQHIIVEGHDSYVELVCSSISIERASPDETAAFWDQLI